jgi:membrane protease YdiL (CAAX protease family)
MLFPRIIQKWKGGNGYDFKLANLSKILSIVLLMAILSYGLDRVFELLSITDVRVKIAISFYSYLLFKLILAGAFLLVVLRLSPLRCSSSLINLVNIPSKETNVVRRILMVLFVILVTLNVVLKVESFPQDVLRQYFVILSSLYENYILVGLLFPVELLAAASEELVYRYYAINALKRFFGKEYTILIASIIWTLMHGKISLELFGTGLLLSYLYYKTESLLTCILMHLMYNVIITTAPFYVFYTKAGTIAWSSLNYGVLLLAFQLLLLFIVEMVFERCGSVARNAS